MVGGTFNGHPWNAGDTVTITVHEPEHPTMKPFGKEFTIKDEIYQYKNWQPEKVRVLMSLDMSRCKPSAPYHVPVAWVKCYGEGRVYFHNLGHNESTWLIAAFSNPSRLESNGSEGTLMLNPHQIRSFQQKKKKKRKLTRQRQRPVKPKRIGPPGFNLAAVTNSPDDGIRIAEHLVRDSEVSHDRFMCFSAQSASFRAHWPVKNRRIHTVPPR